VTRGPKENRFRPALDPLFRSAAYNYGPRSIGVVLSGALDDGTSGLWTIKHRGGLAVVQDPNDADISSMPENAIREVDVDHIVPVADMPELLVRLSSQEVPERAEGAMQDSSEDKRTRLEIRIAAEDNALEAGVMEWGELSPFTCPDCSGVLSKIKDGNRPRFRCHTGHAFSSDSLLAALTETIEESLPLSSKIPARPSMARCPAIRSLPSLWMRSYRSNEYRTTSSVIETDGPRSSLPTAPKSSPKTTRQLSARSLPSCGAVQDTIFPIINGPRYYGGSSEGSLSAMWRTCGSMQHLSATVPRNLRPC